MTGGQPARATPTRTGASVVPAVGDSSERRLDQGAGPFLFREFLEHYQDEDEALRRWRAAEPVARATGGLRPGQEDPEHFGLSDVYASSTHARGSHVGGINPSFRPPASSM